MKILPETSLVGVGAMTSAELRQNFLIEGLFAPDKLELVYTGLDRGVVGSAVPQLQKLSLGPTPELRSAFLCERRELGVLNIGGSGAVTVDGTRHVLAAQDALYVGRGSRQVEFESDQTSTPARFYLVSYPAHAAYPTRHVCRADAQPMGLGSRRDANERTIYKYIHAQGVQSCQLVMGFTQLKEGSVWNTMPPHTHLRRTEIYLYFDLEPDACVMHFMGKPEATRHLVVRNEQAILSPGWSIHCGAGTRHYSFAWAMGGENQEFTDMDPVKVPELF
jgi:4-deoxy-L-threo-5-hexosulose-uronate ketol-isomerase